MLFYTFQTFQINLICLFKIAIFHIDLGPQPCQLELLQLIQLIIPVRTLIPVDILQCAINHLQGFGMVLFLLESVIELFLFFKEDLIEVEGGRRLGQGLGLVNAVVALLLAEF